MYHVDKSLETKSFYAEMISIAWFIENYSFTIFMPPPLGAGGIMFSGCPSVRPSVRSLKYPLLTCTWVRWSTRPTVTVLRHVRPSVRRGFWAFAGERMEGMARNFTCWCILTIFRTDYFVAMVCWFYSFWHYFDLVKQVKFGVSGHFLENA